MNFDNYIPNKKITILLGGKEISVLSINRFKIDINILQASYEVDIKQIDCDSIMNKSMANWMIFQVRLIIGNFETPCEMTMHYQELTNCTCCISLSCCIDPNVEQTYNHLEEKQTRFDILDL